MDLEGAPFARASALIAAISDGGNGGGGGGSCGRLVGSGGGSSRGSGGGGGGGGGDDYVDGEDGDAACQLEAALFLQQLALFAPRAAPPARLVPRLRPVLAAVGVATSSHDPTARPLHSPDPCPDNSHLKVITS